MTINKAVTTTTGAGAQTQSPAVLRTRNIPGEMLSAVAGLRAGDQQIQLC